MQFHGLSIEIEVEKGGTRRAKDGSWVVRDFPADYGHVRRTKGADGEAVDVYVGPNPSARTVFVINQRKKGGGFDEHKAMLGFNSEDAARSAHRRGVGGQDLVMSVARMSTPAFVEWVESATMSQPVKTGFGRHADSYLRGLKG